MTEPIHHQLDRFTLNYKLLALQHVIALGTSAKLPQPPCCHPWRRCTRPPSRSVSRPACDSKDRSTDKIVVLGCIWASAGFDVKLRDPSAQQRADGIAYIEENVQSYSAKTNQIPGSFEAVEDMKHAVENAWLVIEAVPEKLDLKIATFAELEALTPEDCILASNSSSYKSSEMISQVSDSTKTRVLNMHYYMPPACMIVELMTDGYTSPEIFPFMVERCKEAATNPYVARKESTGFIFNRLWAAVKREVLTILAEGVSVPEEIDSMWLELFVKGGTLPCRTMDSKILTRLP